MQFLKLRGKQDLKSQSRVILAFILKYWILNLLILNKVYRKKKAQLPTIVITLGLLLLGSLLLHTPLGYCLMSFYLISQDSLSFSCRAGLAVLNSLSFCLFGNILVSPSLFENSFSRQKTWLVYIYFFSLYHFESISPLPSGLQSF